ncbi:MAG: glutamine synthetase III [Clostridia bacterium]|nr:glutamine synthetase III [Clostridia bacterium]
MNRISELFGSMSFNDEVMREKLPKEIYKSLHKTIEEGTDLDITVANVVANAMKDWAIEKGATHYTHWFQPMTGITAEKHDSFLTPSGNGKVIMEFSGKELIKGEPDASSFPSGGLRSTFEARGYTTWDPTSYAFIKDDSLCIPTVFCSYGGQVLDKKTPLLRSMERVNEQTLRILKLFGMNDVTHVSSTVGAEQEYFLIDRDVYNKRKDLMLTGRTMFGTKPPKCQELDDHYFGAIKPRVMAFMKELNEELWKVGIYAKTEHNEAAPAQHELAPVFTTTNIATDQNQLTMEIMKRVAIRHNMICLLHEKPFGCVNGSGKHNNWSLSTNTGVNLFNPGKNPADNKLFLLFLCAVIKAVDEHQDLLRISVASAGNDHRLGADEAPPAIVSIYLGEQLTDVLASIEHDTDYTEAKAQRMSTGVHVLADFRKDTSDRNRTSPFAFTGNKFEFRMLGSTLSIAEPNIVLNTIAADVFSEFADRLEKAQDFEHELKALLKETIRDHKRIIFNGNNYSQDWVELAEKRGLLNLKTTADAAPHYTDEKNVALFERQRIFTSSELESRRDIMLEHYNNVYHIEIETMLEMVHRDILPAVFTYSADLAQMIEAKQAIGMEDAAGKGVLTKVNKLTDELYRNTAVLEDVNAVFNSIANPMERANYCRDHAISAMDATRKAVDRLEDLVDAKIWPYPSYSDLLFSVDS